MERSCLPSGSVGHLDPDRNEPVGLRNLGNTCYFNAVMQSLLRTNLLMDELQHPSDEHQMNNQPHQQQHPVELGSPATPLTDAFLNFARDVSCRERSATDVLGRLLNAFRDRSTRFIGGGQHDSHDCLIHFLNDLRDDERQRLRRIRCSSTAASPPPTDLKKCLTTVDRVFGGHLLTIYTCLSCGDQHRSCEPLIAISLPIVHSKEERSLDKICTENGNGELTKEIEYTLRTLAPVKETSSKKFHFIKTSVKRCFIQFTRREEIREEYLCHSCQSKGDGGGVGGGDPHLTSAVKITLVYNPPAVLVLHIKRFEQVLGRFRKRSDRIRYKELLDLGPYCVSSCHRINAQDQNVWYALFGVIVHQGSLTRGHYKAYVKVGKTDEARDRKTFLQTTYLDRDAELTKTKSCQEAEKKGPWKPRSREEEVPNPPSGQWYYVSDESVRRLKGAKKALNKEAYLLFYERIGTPLQTAEKEKFPITTASGVTRASKCLPNFQQ